jgi:hypothetical protein
MYHEEIGKITSEHLRLHINAYLDELEVRYADSVKLAKPKAIEYANLVGGVYNTELDNMPAYAVDITQKRFSGLSNNSLWEYAYDGHIAGVVTGGSEKEVNTLVKRHEQAVEMFIKRHGNMHATEHQVPGNDFRIIEVGFVDADFSGAELVEERTNRRKRWLAGFRITLIWIVSEDGPTQHV